LNVILVIAKLSYFIRSIETTQKAHCFREDAYLELGSQYLRFACWWARFSLMAYVNISMELIASSLSEVGCSLPPSTALAELRRRCKQMPSIDIRNKVCLLLIRNRLTELHHANLSWSRAQSAAQTRATTPA
jgi:hypothetical protein